MAYRSAPLLEDVIWRTHLQPQDPTLAETVRATIAENREHLLEFIRLDEPAPLSALTLAQWSSPTALRSLLAVYSDHIYRNQPLMLRENKPLISLWAQWYDDAAINAGAVNTGKSVRSFPGTFSR